MENNLKEKGKAEISKFRQFVVETNLMGLAIAVIIGASFRNVILVLINGIIMPAVFNQPVAEYKVGNLEVGALIAAGIEFSITLVTIYFIYRLFKRMNLSK